MKKIVLTMTIMVTLIVACGSADNAPDLFTTLPPTVTPPDSGGPDVILPDVSVPVLPDAAPPRTPPPSCVAQSDVAFCGTYGKQCGVFTATDNCGDVRSVTSCGSCSVGEACAVNTCKGVPPDCVPVSDGVLCATLGNTCGVLNTFDNCGKLRNIASCGTCVAPTTCAVNICVSPPPPVCVAESNAAFCARNGNCGTKTALDNCGNLRTVVSCGSLRFSANGEMYVSGGVPNEVAGLNVPKHVEMWISSENATNALLSIGRDDPNYPVGCGGNTFRLKLSNGYLALDVSCGAAVSHVAVPLRDWTFVFAGFDPISGYYVGKVYNNVITREYLIVNGRSLLTANQTFTVGGSYGGELYAGQTNNIRVWNIARANDEIVSRYHDCLPTPVFGLVRQWCALEGAGSTTIDSVTHVSSNLNAAAWCTGACF